MSAKKIILIGLAAVVGVAILIFAWRVFYFYRLVKRGERPSWAIEQSQLPKRELNDTLIATFSPRLGNQEAAISIVEFGDYDCSFSQQAFPALRELLAKNSQKIDFVFRFFPATGNTEDLTVPLAAACANEQGKFWSYHDKLFQNPSTRGENGLLMLAQQAGLDNQRFQNCLSSKKYQAQVEDDMNTGLSAGVSGTPTFFVNGLKAEGAIPLAEWEKLLSGVK